MNIYLVSVIFCAVFILITIELIRRKKLAERYALLWLILGLVMLIFSLLPGLLETVSRALHIYYAPSLLFLVGFLFSLIFIMHLTIVISKLHRKLTRLVQEIALLKSSIGKEDPHDDIAHRID
jgi:hypothetical protein